MSTDAVDFAVVDDVPPVPDHLRILDAREEYHRAVITCCRSFGRRRYARAVRRQVRYLEIMQHWRTVMPAGTLPIHAWKRTPSSVIAPS